MPAVAVHVAGLDADARDLATLALVIDREERARAARFRFDRDRRRFVVRRAMLRSVLGRIVGEAPERLVFTQNQFGKPALAGGPQFSLSHSSEMMMLATADVAVGCDIEWIDAAMDWRPVADQLFSSVERRALAAMPDVDGRRAFFDCWARKEAFVKAIGMGLSHPLDAFDVSVVADARILSGGDGWAMTAVSTLTGYAGAVVALDDGAPLAITVREASRLAIA